jgi:ATP-dependent protease ClpP protease subunit
MFEMNLPANLADVVNKAASSAGKGIESIRLELFEKDADAAELLVMGTVGDEWEGLSSGQVVSQLASVQGRKLNVRINSPGGLAFDGVAIYNALIQHDGEVTTTIEGLAGSAASIIAMAGSKIRMFENAMLFIHRAMGMAMGNSVIMRDIAETLEKIDEGMLKVYQRRTGLTDARLNKMLTGAVDGTSMTAKEAKTLGFVDEVLKSKSKQTETADSAIGNVHSGASVTSTLPQVAACLTEKQEVIAMSEKTPATYRQIVAACPGIEPENAEDAMFIASVQKQDMTAEEASAEWCKTLKARIDSARAEADEKDEELKKKAEKEAEEKEKEEAKVKAASGVKSVGTRASGKTHSAENPADEWNAEVDNLVAKGMDRAKAVRTLNRKRPELREAIVAFANN